MIDDKNIEINDNEILNNYPNIEENERKILNSEEINKIKDNIKKKSRLSKLDINNYPILNKEFVDKNNKKSNIKNCDSDDINIITKKIKNQDVDILF